jgi:hypothetical protein
MSEQTGLVRYEQARVALAECVKVDEAAEMRDKAAAMALYARQRDDKQMEAWVKEIHLRACIRIGELSRELEKAAFADGPGVAPRLPPSGKTKAIDAALIVLICLTGVPSSRA